MLPRPRFVRFLSPLLVALALLWALATLPPAATTGPIGQAATTTSRADKPYWRQIGYAEHAGNDRQSDRKADDWIRTRMGWERRSSWALPRTVYQPRLHPAVVTALICLAALWALLAFPAKEEAEPDQA